MITTTNTIGSCINIHTHTHTYIHILLASTEPSNLKRSIQAYSATIEGLIESVSRPVKPHLNKLGRFLLVSTFIEDALRIFHQFDEQKDYLTDDAEYPEWFVTGFLISNVVLMIACSILIVFKQWTLPSIIGLLIVIVSQGYLYDLMTDTTFVCLNLSIMGALMLALSDTWISSSNSTNSKRSTVAGLPDISEDLIEKRSKYLQLAGRILVSVFFVGHAVVAYVQLATENFTIPHLVTAVLSVIACTLVAVGFKARWSALFLVIVTSTVNVLSNDWWTKPKDHPERDFRRFDFFQALSVVGGMILLINQGPGGISFDAKRKTI